MRQQKESTAPMDMEAIRKFVTEEADIPPAEADARMLGTVRKLSKQKPGRKHVKKRKDGG